MSSFSLYIIDSAVDSSTARDILNTLDIEIDTAVSDVLEHQTIQRGLSSREASRLHQLLLDSSISTIILLEGDFELESDLPLNLHIEDESGTPLAGATVTVRTPNDDLNNHLSTLTTDNRGEVSFKSFSSLVNEFTQELPPVWFEITHEGVPQRLLHNAFSSWHNFLAGQDIVYEIQVGPQPMIEEPGKASENPTKRSIRGTVVLEDGNSVAGFRVAAYDRDLRDARLLGETLTDEGGHYRIEYDVAADALEVGSADLLMRVFGEAGAEVKVEVSNRDLPRVRGEQVLFNAGVDETLDLLVTEQPDLSLFEITLAGLEPALVGTSLAALTPDDAVFLSHDTGLPLEDVAFVAEDARLQATTELPTGVLFGLAKEGYGTLQADDAAPAPRIDLDSLLNHPVDTLMEAFDAALEGTVVPNLLATEREAVETRLRELAAARQTERNAREQIKGIGLVTGLDEAKADTVATVLGGSIVDTTTFDGLVADGVIDEAQRTDLEHSFNVGALTGNNLRLTELVLKGEVPKLSGSVQELSNLANIAPSDWQTVIEANDVAVPDGFTSETYSARLAANVEALYPTAALARTTVKQDRSALSARLERTQTLLSEKPDLLQRAMREPGEAYLADADLSLNDTNSDLAKDVQTLAQTVRTFRHLGLADTLTSQLSAAAKAQEVERRIGAMDTFFSNNAEFDIRSADLLELDTEPLPDGAAAPTISYDGIDQELQPLVQQQALAYQRVHNVAPDAKTTSVLLSGGYDSAHAIANTATNVIARTTGLSVEAAGGIRQAAENRAVEGRVVAMNAMLVGGVEMRSTKTEPPERIDTVLRKLRAALGNQNLCNCRHCSSVLSPAAYFVDLMRFVDKHITDMTEVLDKIEDHPMRLSSRRPDLWELALTCENSTQEISYLEVINGVMERYIAGAHVPLEELGLGDTSTIKPRDLERRATQLRAERAYQFLKEGENSFAQPFHLPLTELRVYLTHFGVSLSTIIETVDGWTVRAAQERLTLSPDDWRLITTPNQNDAHLKRLYRVGESPDERLETQRVATFQKATGLSRSEVDRLIALPIFGGTPPQITVIPDKADELRPSHEELDRLNPDRLDLIHRFVRLLRGVPWTLEALTFLIQRDAPSFVNNPNEEELQHLAAMRRVQQTLNVPTEVLCALTGLVPSVPFSPGETPLFDRLFNLPRLVPNEDDRWTTESQPIIFHPALAVEGDGTTVTSQVNLHRIIGGLSVSDEVLGILLRELRMRLNPDGSSITLTHERLSRLYRHAKLAQLLKLEVAELFAALRLIQDKTDQEEPTEDAAAQVNSLSDIRNLLAFLDWQRQGVLSITELYKIVTGKDPAIPEVILPAPRQAIEPALKVASTTLDLREKSFIDAGLSSFDATNLVKLLTESNVLEAVEKDDEEEHYQIAAAYDPDQELTLVEQANEPLELIESRNRLKDNFDRIQAVLNAKLPEKQGITALANEMDVSPALFRAGLDLAGVNLQKREEVRSLFREVREVSALPETLVIDALLLQISFASRLREWLEPFSFDGEAIDFILSNKGLFKHENLGRLNVETLRLFTIYHHLRERVEPDEQGEIDYSQLHRLLPEFGQEDEVDAAYLAVLFESTPVQIRSYLALADESNTLEKIDKLQRCLALGKRLGVDGKTLKLLALDEYDKLADARELVLGAFRAKHNDEADFEKTIEPYRDRLRGARRDALMDYILALPDLSFEEPNDLYYFFLLDPELEGCARTSRIVAATQSVQLYVQRCLMGLEQTESGLRAALDERVVEEWTWRKNYRVWEANRKVFLYPENYAEPDLRGNKSPLFKALEEELLQQEITEETVEAAYRKYIEGFMEVASLKTVGACWDKSEDTFHVFAKSTINVGRLFRRKMTKVGPKKARVWTAWQEVQLAVDVEHMSPIVLNGKLYLLWVEARPLTKTKVENGNLEEEKWLSCHLRVSYLSETDQWSQPIEMPIKELTTPENWSPFFRNRIFPYSVDNKLLIERAENTTSTGDLPSSSITETVDFFERKLVETSIKERRRKGYLEIEHERESNRLVGIQETVSDYLAAFYSSKGGRVKVDEKVVKLSAWDRKTFRMQPVLGGIGSYLLGVREEEFLLDLGFTTLYANRLTAPSVEHLARKLNNNGIDAFLSLNTQKMAEPPFPVRLVKNSSLKPVSQSKDRLDFTGPFGTYYRELFFHIPLLIAQHLNANGHFKETQHWYHYVFDPTADKPAEDKGNKGPAWHYWQYLELRELGQQSLANTLMNGAALEMYRKDPFNPHAIASLRQSAYKRFVVMRYIDNLLDWGDHLFAQDTREAINEAALLYTMAQDLLGDRPLELGECDLAGDEDDERPITYKDLDKNLGDNTKNGGGFLQTAENVVYSLREATGEANAPLALQSFATLGYGGTPYAQELGFDTSHRSQITSKAAAPVYIEASEGDKQVFCVPQNQDLLKYWDRVEDRLFKIRNCLNLSGVRRELSLFAPPIDPAFLVRAKAAGLTLEDAISLTSSPLPPYRFTYLLAKAKEYTATVRGFGSSLLSALEKKDVAELTQLRSVQQQNILKLTRLLKEKQLDMARHNLEALQESRKTSQLRRDHYSNLLDEGLTPWEITQITTQHTSSILYGSEATLQTVAGIVALIPEVGSPFAMTFGGKQLGKSAQAIAHATRSLAAVNSAIASSAGLEASFQRREQGWTYQKDLADKELVQIDKQIAVATLRIEAAEHDLVVHDTSAEQADEVYEFYKDQFTNLGLYTWLAKELNKLYRQSYNLAHKLARSAQAAYKYERDDDTLFIQPGHWDSQKAGLLAGERLQLQLSELEQAYITKNTRALEIDQTFSLTQINPVALQTLRKTGACSFSLSEVFFDLAYPGHYKRRIKSVRLSIPCATGPYVSVGAKLSLTGSKIRLEPTLNSDDSSDSDSSSGGLVSVPQPVTTSIATSRAQNDSGVFELSFRDERYLPFEGAGAVSDWRLELPNEFRAFDYDTIADVLVHVSYTALEDGLFRSKVENALSARLIEFAKESGFGRILHLAQAFPAEYAQLFLSGVAPSMRVPLEKRLFPYFLRDQKLVLEGITLYLELHDPWDTQVRALKPDEINTPTLLSTLALPTDETESLFKVVEEGAGFRAEVTVRSMEIGDDSALDLTFELNDLKSFLDSLTTLDSAGSNGVPLNERFGEVLKDIVVVLNVELAGPNTS